ncbi:choice-of-anchor P family protein [Nocardioides bruguierae]|uniref:DUF5666 domain-containing protein n=1 Tax=Nocardioides bruguierae TaxID=2945102 RepID=A0A9X2IFE8_9ACTN|nr:choice-of-anchor P family protein [Nocardioides bruguierae]MCM0620349.1 hypothetical protein [Nocardioides bruguierae]
MSPHHMTARRPVRLSTVVAGVASAALGATLALAPTSAQARVDDEGTPTPFAMKAKGFGTTVIGDQIPADSQKTGRSVVSCTSMAGVGNRNFVAEAELPEDVATVRGVASHSRTLRKPKKGIVATVSRERVAEVVLAQTELGTLSIQGLRSTATAQHGPDGFRAITDNQIGRIVLTPALGDPVEIEIPDADTPITIPGLATIELGRNVTKQSKRGAYAYSVAAKITVIPTGTKVFVGRTTAQMDRGVINGVFEGSAAAVKANVLGDLLQVGRAVNQVMPCAGTEGEAQSNAAADTTGMLQAQGLDVGAAKVWQRGDQSRRKTAGIERSQIADLTLGPITVDAIKGAVRVARLADGTLKRNASTQVIGFSMDGEQMAPEDLNNQVVEIPGGLLKIQTNVVKRYPGGIRLVPLRLTLLDGTDIDSVVDLGFSRLAIVD